jgi:hypothetical protein
MKRRILVSVMLLTLLSATAGAGGIDARSAAGPANDFVLASFDDQYGTHYFINAWSGPTGEKPRGAFETSIPWFKGHVRCLAVRRHEALVIGDNREFHFHVSFLLRDNRPGPDEFFFLDFGSGSWVGPCPPFSSPGSNPGTPVSGNKRARRA